MDVKTYSWSVRTIRNPRWYASASVGVFLLFVGVFIFLPMAIIEIAASLIIAVLSLASPWKEKLIGKVASVNQWAIKGYKG